MAITLTGEIAVSLAHHPRKAYTVGLHRREFDVFMQLAVLLTYPRGIEEKVHAACLADEALQGRGSILTRHVDSLYCRGSYVLHPFGATRSDTYCPPLLDQQACHLAPDARGSSYDDSFLSLFHFTAPFICEHTVLQ